MSAMPLSSTSATIVLAMLAVTGGLINAAQTTMYALAAHVYPSDIRATGVGSALSFGRIGAVLSGYVGAFALEYGASSFFVVIAAAMGACGVALAMVKRHIVVRR
jgi:AAHS family 4-hydroxybenzoate transporter-like MFS transporter